MAKFTLSKEEARRFLVNYHGLGGLNTYKGEQGILKYVARTGCIQYDPLNVVGRNADLVLQSRISGYSAGMLEKLLYTDRALIDGWDKMMSIYSTQDWPFFIRIRNEKQREVLGVLKARDSIEAVEFTQEIREILVKRGPLLASQIKLGEAGKGKWGHRNLSGAAMDFMFNIGELGVFRKKGTQKIYDLIENLLPEELLKQQDPFKSDQDFYKWYFKRRIGSVGLLWDRNGGGWLGHFLSDKELRKQILEELVEEKSIVEATIEGIDETFYMRQEDVSLMDTADAKVKADVRFLAPLDNLLWDRDMIDRIFNFKYSWEVYLPAEKRKFGYYVLPVLYGDRFVARFEPEIQRGNEPLKIKNWWWEEGIKVSSPLKKAVIKGFERFARYLGTEFDEDKTRGRFSCLIR